MYYIKQPFSAKREEVEEFIFFGLLGVSFLKNCTLQQTLIPKVFAVPLWLFTSADKLAKLM